jgi:hypothetical protein
MHAMESAVPLKMISFALILLVLIAAIAIPLIVLAISNRRLGAVLLVGGLAFAGMLGVPAVLMLLYFRLGGFSHPSMNSMANTYPESSHWTVNAPSVPPISITTDHTTVWAISFVPLLFVGFGVIALLVVAARRSFAHSNAGHGKIWPAFLALPVLAIFLWGNVRYQASTSSRQAAQSAQRIQRDIDLQQQREAIRQRQQAIADSVATMNKGVQQQIQNMDIHELMDKFDAPRITLSAPMAPSAAPAALFVVAATPASTVTLVPEIEEAHAEDPPAKTSSGSGAGGSSPRKKRPPKSAESFAAVGTARNGEVVKRSSAHSDEHSAATANAESSPSNPLAAEAAELPSRNSGVRPSWVDNPPKRVGDVQREVIATDEWSSDEECEQARSLGLMLKTYERIQKLIGVPYQSNLSDHKLISDSVANDYRLNKLASSGITLDYALRQIAKDEYVESVQRSVGPMKKIYTLVEFTPAVDRELRQRWDGYARQEQFAKVGLGATGILGLLTLVWGLLKVDTATKGYYTKRLFVGVSAAVICVMLLLWADPLQMF